MHAYVLPLQSLRKLHAGVTQDETNMKVCAQCSREDVTWVSEALHSNCAQRTHAFVIYNLVPVPSA